MAENAKKSTESRSESRSERKPERKPEAPKSQKAASAKAHVVSPGVSNAFTGPTQDDLNPAYAPLKADEE